MTGTYFTINKNDEMMIYFSCKINKTYKYSAHGNEYYNYNIIINELDVDNKIDFDETFGGIFIWKTEDNQLKLYDNLKKSFINFDELSSGDNSLSFEYYSKQYGDVDLEFVVKEILFNIFVKNEYY